MDWCHGGDVGDTLYAIAPMQHKRPGKLSLVPGEFAREPYTPRKAALWAEVFALQPGVTAVEFSAAARSPIDMWRWGSDRNNIVQRHAFALGVSAPLMPGWLRTDKKDLVAATLVARGPRHATCNQLYQWAQRLLDAVFVGLADEHAAFEAKFGPIPFHATERPIDLLRAIAGCDHFVGSPSLPLAMAIGLGVARIDAVFHNSVWFRDCGYRYWLPDDRPDWD